MNIAMQAPAHFKYHERDPIMLPNKDLIDRYSCTGTLFTLSRIR
jgi:hypothetical protein